MNKFTHIDSKGDAVMVDVSGKAITARTAVACGRIAMSRDCYEAVKAVCDCLLNTLHTDMLIAGAIEKNTVSLHMLQKLGFAFEGRRTKGFYHPVYGPVDLLYYVLERKEETIYD